MSFKFNSNWEPDFAVRPCEPKVNTLAEALVALVRADTDLQEAIRLVPDYTAPDYISKEQDVWNRAAEEYYRAVCSATTPNLLR